MTTPERLAKVAEVLRQAPLGWDFFPEPVAALRTVTEALRPLLDEFAAQDYATGAASVIACPEQALAEAWDEGAEKARQYRDDLDLSPLNPYRTPQTHATAPLSDAQPERESDSHRHGNGAQNGREDA